MNNLIKNENVPELRFPGFEGNFKPYKLESVTEKIQDGTHFSPNILEIGKYKYITSRNIRNGYMDLNDVYYLSDKEHHNIYKRCNVQFNDVLMTKDGANTGNVCLNELEEEFSLLSSVAFIRSNNRIAINDYIYQYISSPIGQREINKVISGQAITRITLTKLRNFKFFFPTLPEQQKIAAFLSAVDKKIEKLTRKKELLQVYKKGVMQKIFSQEIRFNDDDGKAFPDWEEKKIRKFVISDKSGMKIGPFGSQLKKDTLVKDGYKVYGQENVFVKDFSLGARFITKEHFERLKSNELQPGDFIISTMGTIGKSCVVPDCIKKGIMDSHLIRLRLDKEIIYSGYLKQVFLLFEIQKQIKRYSVGGIMDGLSMGIINELKFNIPKSITEQRKIADFLSNIDKKIESVQTQLAQTQTFKKGLLQKMFV